MKAGLATIALRHHDIFHAVDLAAEAGFLGVEIWGRAPHTPDEFDENFTRRIREHVRGSGLEVCMFGSYANPSSPDFEQKAPDALNIAKTLGTRLIRVWAGNKEPHEADDELWSHVAASLHEFALRAEYDGITLAIEMHCGTLCLTPEGSLRLIEEANAPNLKLNYQIADPSNPDAERVIGLIGDHVVNVHAQNRAPSALEGGKTELSWIEEGQIDYDQVLALLAKHGFNGFVEAEFLKGESVSEDAVLESLRKDAEYLRALTAKYGS